jgi:uncharacterized protein (TIGR02996 family)
VETRTLFLLEDGTERSFEITWEGSIVEVVEAVDGIEREVARHVLTSREVASFVQSEIDGRLARGWLEREEGSTGPVAINEDLERMIRADPEAVEPYLVYADWLASHGDPRGELIAMQHAQMSEAAENLMRRRPDYFLGELATVTEATRLEWRLGFIRSAVIAPPRDAGDPAHMTAVTVRRLLGHHSSRFLRRLEIQRFEEGSDYSETIEAMIELGLPATTIELALGRINASGAPVGAKLPRLGEVLRSASLERAIIRGGAYYQERALELNGLSLPNARHLELRTDQLQDEALEAIADAAWPKLETLVLAASGIDCERLAAMIEGNRFPALTLLDLSASVLSQEDSQVVLQSATHKKIRVQLLDPVVRFDDAYEDEGEVEDDSYDYDLYEMFEEEDAWESDEFAEDNFEEDPW